MLNKISCVSIVCSLISFWTAHGSYKIPPKAQQIHAKIDALLSDLATIVPQQSDQAGFDPKNITIDPEKSLTIEEIEKFLYALQLSTHHLNTLQQQFQSQEQLVIQHQKNFDQLIQVAQWFYHQKSIQAWRSYKKFHESICAIVRDNLVALEGHVELQEICQKIGQTIINALSIWIIQLHQNSEYRDDVRFLTQAHFDFNQLFSSYGVTTHPKVHEIIRSCAP